ncbi:hypothetical protein OCH239_04845 [Roseivivax halodurans JCM 10272]|uniref:Uncharacterized protein n=1 Tax=Roseivivax halodurans JCM 10272 TaxID=1449350 RepID=X7EG23_9RHOB|nr:hypothetical protein [Roseivivax halodurans]ETX14181.1 hypothetical protein OCH239_04845 [Roseivivax halodurans JCM 10272]
MRLIRLVLATVLMGALLPWGALARDLPPQARAVSVAAEDAAVAAPSVAHEKRCRLAGSLGAACTPAVLSDPARVEDPSTFAPGHFVAEGAWPARSRGDAPPRDPPRPV